MPKAELLADLRAARERLLSTLEGLSEEDMLRVGAVGIWSVKDVLAHLVSWEAELVTALAHLSQSGGQPPHIVEIEDIDEWNAEQYRTNAPRPLTAVLEDFHAVHKHLPEAVAERFPTPDSLRRFALIRTGHRDERSIACASKAEALRVAAFVQPMDDCAVVTVTGALVTVYTPRSQSMRAK